MHFKQFQDDQREEAIEFLVSRKFSKKVFGEKFIPENTSDENANELLRRMINLCYGKNVVLMANYAYTQHIFYDKYCTNIMLYLNHCGINAQIQNTVPYFIVPFILSIRASEKGFKAIKPYDPNITWDNLDNCDDCTRNLVNPLNPFDITHVFMEDITNHNFIKYLKENFDASKLIIRPGYTQNALNISVKVLPDKDLRNILNLIYGIHRYF